MVISIINMMLSRERPTYYLHLPATPRRFKRRRQFTNVQGIRIPLAYKDTDFADFFEAVKKAIQPMYPGWSIEGWALIQEIDDATPQANDKCSQADCGARSPN